MGGRDENENCIFCGSHSGDRGLPLLVLLSDHRQRAVLLLGQEEQLTSSLSYL